MGRLDPYLIKPNQLNLNRLDERGDWSLTCAYESTMFHMRTRRSHRHLVFLEKEFKQMESRMSHMEKRSGRNRGSRSGFTLIELLLVVVVSLILAAITVPNIMTYIHNARIQGAGNDFAGLLQQARIHAVQDDNYYGTYFSTVGSLQVAYVDLSQNGGASVTSRDPLIQFSTEVVPTAAGSAPDTSNLKSQFLPTGSTLPVNDGSTSTTPIIFNSRGLPCTSITANGGTVCSSGSNNATAFWIFFQDNVTHMWEGVTISPAGRIQKWRHTGSVWSKM